MSELHGVETLELVSGAIAIKTVATAVIGLVGTAPDAQTAVAATGESGSLLLRSRMQFSATTPGRTGNALRIDAVAAAGGGAAGPLLTEEKQRLLTEQPEGSVLNVGGGSVTSAQWDSKTGVLTLSLATDDAGNVIATATDVVGAVAALAESGITAVLPQGLTGEGIVTPFSLTLSGGQDEAFPINTPVVVAGSTGQASKIGLAGTLYNELNDVFDQYGALVIVVRAETKDTPEEQRAAVIAAMAGLVASKTVTTYQPRILIAPSFSDDDAVAKALETKAEKLKAITYIESAPGASVQDVVLRRDMFGGRVELLRPRVQVADTDGQLVYRPYSARAAGLRARIDNEKGWWWSKSNQDVYNILGVEQVDDWSLSDPNSTANLLNMDNVSTIIRHDGFKHWGNRLCVTHPQLRFESVRRTADIIEDSIQEAMMPFLDQPLDKWVRDDILDSINSYFRTLIKLRAIFGGSAWLNAELNTAETLAAGQLWIDYDFGPKSPLERLTLRANPTNNSYALAEMAAA